MRTLILRLPTGADLYDSLSKIVRDENIKIGHINAIGATSHAVIAYYDQASRKYLTIEFSDGMEIVSLIGNISIREGNPFVHVHVTLGDSQGRLFGGHLLQGTKVFACEVLIQEFEGNPLVREYDESTGLYLWKTDVGQ